MYVTKEDLEKGIENIRNSPKDEGIVELIVCRPDVDERRELKEAELDVKIGLIGDNWLSRGNSRRADNTADPDTQLNIMNARSISLIARTKENWKLAGDQLYVDLDLSPDNLPPGTQLKVGSALIEVTDEPHLGCKKFMERYGKDATVFINSDLGKSLNMRGINAKILRSGIVKRGSLIKKIKK